MSLHVYAADLLLASRAIQDGNLGTARAALERQRPQYGGSDLRGFEWSAFHGLCRGDDLHTFTGHTAAALAARFSPDGKTIVSGGRDGQVIFFDAATGVEKLRSPKPGLPTGAAEIPLFAKLAAVSPDVRALLAAEPKRFDDLRMRWRPSKSGPVTAVAWSPDGTQIATSGDGSSLRIWDAVTGDMEWFSPAWGFHKLEFTRDGKWLAGFRRDTSGASGRIEIYDTTNRTLVRSVDGARLGFALPPSGDTIVIARPGGTVEIQSIASGAIVTSFRTGEEHHEFASAGTILASVSTSGYSVVIWDFAKGTQLRVLQTPGPIRNIALSPDASLLAILGTEHILRVFNTADMTLAATLRGHESDILDIAFSPDAARIVTAGNDMTVRQWSPRGAQKVAGRPAPPGRLAEASATSPRALFLHEDGAVECWNAATRSGATTPPAGGRRSARFVPGGFLTTRFEPHGIVVENWTLDAAPRGTPVTVRTIENSTDAEISPSGATLAVSDLRRFIRVIPVDGSSAGTRLKFERSPFTRAAFSPDGKFLTTFHWPSRLGVWNLADNVALGRRSISAGNVGDVTFSPDSRLLAIGGNDNLINIQHVNTGDTVAVLSGHKAAIHALAFSPDGRTLASTSADLTVRLWHVATWRELGIVHQGLEFKDIAFAGDRLIGATSSERVVIGGDGPTAE